MFYVYILKSEVSDNIYTGFTTDLQKRLKYHNAGYSPHTSKFLPWRVVAYMAFDSEKKAREFEAYLKTGSGIAFARRHFQ